MANNMAVGFRTFALSVMPVVGTILCAVAKALFNLVRSML
jgi:hypothetical protein